MSRDGALIEPPRERRVRLTWWGVTAVGLVITAIGFAQPVSFWWFGWSGQAPEQPVVLSSVILVHYLAVVGLIIAVTGGLVTAYLHGRRRGPR